MNRRRAERIREAILNWAFPIAGTVGLLAAFVAALFSR